MTQKPAGEKLVCQNKKAGFRFELLERLECGIVLMGTEVKSLRSQSASLDESYARIDDGQLWLIDFHISPYKYGHTANHEPMRARKLLIHGRELQKLQPKVTQRGLTLVPVRVYFNERGLAKVTIALARGKTGRDKRQDMKARDHKLEMDRATRKNR